MAATTSVEVDSQLLARLRERPSEKRVILNGLTALLGAARHAMWRAADPRR